MSMFAGQHYVRAVGDIEMSVTEKAVGLAEGCFPQRKDTALNKVLVYTL